MRFSKLDDTRFPNLDTVNVYSFKNNFDYTRWTEGTKITLTNVLWNSDYKDVVKFESNEERDSYFDNLSDTHVIKLQSNQRIIPDAKSYNYVDLPVPYDVASRYNYIIVEVPIATSPDDMIDYETDTGVRRWYFFLDMITYNAPNTTTCYVTLDAWTNFINDVLIKYMILERGHAPVSATDVDTYLANPIENNEYLLAPDVDFGDTKITKSGTFIPFGNGTKYVCIASTCAPWSIQNVGTVTSDPNSDFNTPITYSDADFRSGFQFNVHGYGVGNGKSYENLYTPADNANGNNRIECNTYVYAIPATDANSFFADMRNNFPSFMRTFVACFVVDEAMLNLGDAYTIGGHTLRVCSGSERNLGNFNLDKNMFGYKSQYAKFAKLYTYPYASLELTDNNGKSVEVRIEDTGNIGIKTISSVAFPYLNMRCFFTGIGGVGSERYSWCQLDGTTIDRDMPNADWARCCFDMEIPTFSVYMDGETAYMLDNYNTSMRNARIRALTTYQNGVRSTNNAKENANDMNKLSKDNIYANADTAARINDRDRNNVQANVNLVKANAAADTEDSINCANKINLRSRQYTQSAGARDNGLSIATTTIENHVTSATTANSTNASKSVAAIQGTTGGAQSGFGTGMAMGTAIANSAEDIGKAGGPIGEAIGGATGAGITIGSATVGAVVGALLGNIIGWNTASISAEAQQSNAIILTQAASDVTAATVTRNQNDWFDVNNNSLADQNEQNRFKTRQTNRNNNLLQGQTTNNNNTSRDDCADNTKNAKACANRSERVGNDCSRYTQTTSVDNAKNTLENTRNLLSGEWKASWKRTPTPVCATSGDFGADYNQTRGVQIKVRRENDSAIAQAGDTFARYGYAFNRSWDIENSGLNLMKNFTYWKCDDVWIDDVHASNNNAVNTIVKIFTNGVTVWNDADKIGKVSVYDN